MKKKKQIIVREEITVPVEVKTEKQARKILNKITKKENEQKNITRFELGKLWNACVYGEKGRLFEEMGYKKQTIKEYSMFVNEVGWSDNPPASLFSHWKIAQKAKVKSADRPALMKKVVDKGWTTKQLRDHLEPKEEEEEFVNVVLPDDWDDGTDDDDDDDDDDYEPAQEKMDIDDAFLIFGIHLTDETITKETYDILHKHYARKHHPDLGGDADKMAELNTASKILQREIV